MDKADQEAPAEIKSSLDAYDGIIHGRPAPSDGTYGYSSGNTVITWVLTHCQVQAS